MARYYGTRSGDIGMYDEDSRWHENNVRARPAGNPPVMRNKHAIDRRGLIFSAITDKSEIARWAGSYIADSPGSACAY